MLRHAHWPVALYDRVYRLCHRLDTPSSEIGSVLCIEFRCTRRALRLADGTLIAPGDPVGVLHMNNDGVRALYVNGGSPMTLGLVFRRQLIASLCALAARVEAGGRPAEAVAFAAITIFHHGLPRLGFERDPVPPAWSHLVGGYQRTLLAVLHPAGSDRIVRLANGRAERLWLSRARLLARYGRQQRAAS